MTTELDVSLRAGEPAAGQGRSLTIAIRGELDIATKLQFADRFDDFFHGEPSHILIDVSELAFVDLAGLRTLARLCAVARSRLITVQLAGVPRQMRGLMSFVNYAWELPAAGRIAGSAFDLGA